MFLTQNEEHQATNRENQHQHQEEVLTELPCQESGHQTQAVCLPERLWIPWKGEPCPVDQTPNQGPPEKQEPEHFHGLLGIRGHGQGPAQGHALVGHHHAPEGGNHETEHIGDNEDGRTNIFPHHIPNMPTVQGCNGLPHRYSSLHHL